MIDLILAVNAIALIGLWLVVKNLHKRLEILEKNDKH